MTDQIGIHQETHLQVLRLLAVNPQMSQRDLATALGVSLGKTNFCMKALLDKGLLKVHNFQSNKRKLAYTYFLTPAGIAEKTALAGRFLKHKIKEYELLRAEIDALQQEAEASATSSVFNANTLKPIASEAR
jgi:EPS-associated MarR family transcriptional regulator